MKQLYFKIQILIVSLVTVSSDQKFFMKLFADAGIGISCPSGNRVYVHPISGDLQQCSQQLGVYNDKSCPGGTVCERFPVPIPGFQDFCCWEDDQKNSEEVIIGTTTSVPEEFFPYTEKPKRKIRPIVEAILEKPDEEDDEDNLEIPPIPKEAIVNIIPEEESSSKDEEWEFETTRRTPRPRSRKVTTTTTTTTEEPYTTTRRSTGSKNRLLRCSNPDDSPFIDFGNRLRDCFPGYYQNTGCFRGYRCEFNKEIRRYICCGQGRDIVPPAGLPDIPPPKPLLPPRPFRPRQGPFNFNDGDQNNNGDDGGYNQQMIITPKGNSNQWGAENRKVESNWNEEQTHIGNNNGNNNNGNSFPTIERGSAKNSMGSNQWNNGGFNGKWSNSDNSMNSNNNRPNWGMEKVPQDNNNWNNNFSNNKRGGDFNKPIIPSKQNGPSNRGGQEKKRGKDYDYDYESDNQWNGRKSSNMNLPTNDNRNTWNSGGSQNNRVPTTFRSRKPVEETCVEGSEYSLAGTVPKCTPPGTDSCPISHPRCLNSLTHGYFVCCL
ncbi:unnamed protein product [Auanema sp. JU1783]|nr:unnamed protein product [Auanema sp. JU1783]